MLDLGSLEANRHGQLSRSQMTYVRRVGIRWVMTAMFATAVGLLLAYAVGNIWFTVLVVLVVGAWAFYLLTSSFDCIADSSNNRVAAIRGRATLLTVDFITAVFSGWREEGWERVTVGGTQFWLPNVQEVMSAAGEITIYFAPQSKLVMNVETIEAAADASAPPAIN